MFLIAVWQVQRLHTVLCITSLGLGWHGMFRTLINIQLMLLTPCTLNKNLSFYLI